MLSEFLGVKRVSCLALTTATPEGKALCEGVATFLPKEGAVTMFLYPGAMNAETFHTLTFIEPRVRRVEL